MNFTLKSHQLRCIRYTPVLSFDPVFLEAETQELEALGEIYGHIFRHVEWLPVRQWEVMEKEVTAGPGWMWQWRLHHGYPEDVSNMACWKLDHRNG